MKDLICKIVGAGIGAAAGIAVVFRIMKTNDEKDSVIVIDLPPTGEEEEDK